MLWIYRYYSITMATHLRWCQQWGSAQVEANRESRLYRTPDVAISSVFKPLSLFRLRQIVRAISIALRMWPSALSSSPFLYSGGGKSWEPSLSYSGCGHQLCLQAPFSIQVEANRESRLYRTQEVAMSSVFKPLRSICARIPMIRGRYVAVPTVFEPGVEGAFTFRIYTSAPNNVR